MAYIVPADFRPETTASWCAGLVLTADQASSPDLTVLIAGISQRVEERTGDYFTKQAGLVLEHDVEAPSKRLYLQRRCTAVTTVKTRYYDESLTTQATSPAPYRLHSSLDAAGAVKIHGLDYLELTEAGVGLIGTYWGPWIWPVGTQTVQVTGDFGWTVTPWDIKRATALHVWDAVFRQSGDLQRAKAFTSGGGARIELADGIPEADAILADYTYKSPVMIG
jgi:hypothetical protein